MKVFVHVITKISFKENSHTKKIISGASQLCGRTIKAIKFIPLDA